MSATIPGNAKRIPFPPVTNVRRAAPVTIRKTAVRAYPVRTFPFPTEHVRRAQPKGFVPVHHAAVVILTKTEPAKSARKFLSPTENAPLAPMTERVPL